MNPADGHCPTDEELLRYLDAPAEDQSLAWVAAHLNDHEACQQRLDELNNLPAALRQALLKARLKPPDVPGYTYELAGNGWPLELGRGGLGVVYKVRRDRDGASFAVKFLFYRGDDAFARFAREVGASLESRHPGIVRAVELGTVEGALYYVMEYVPGKNLSEYLDGRPFPAADPARWGQEVAGWAAGLADAIQHAHANGFLHRDLKPGNVLLRLADGRPAAMKITDFGLARRINTLRVLTLADQGLGTRGYTPPEQIDGRGEVTPAADVYGLGGVLYALLTGKPPFDPTLPDSVLSDRIRKADPEPPGRLNPRVPYDLETICLKCLRKEPAGRYGSAAELADDLRRFVAGDRPRARRQTTLDRLAWWVRHNPQAVRAFTAILGLLLLCAVFLGGAVFYFFQERERTREAQAHEKDARSQAGRADRLAFARLLEAAASPSSAAS
jgi:serine/threonine-protein kinase